MACQEQVRSHSDAMLISAGAVTPNSRTSMATSGVRGAQDSGTLPSQGLLRFAWVWLGWVGFAIARRKASERA